MFEHVWTVAEFITLETYSVSDLYRLRCRTLLDDLFLRHDHTEFGKLPVFLPEY